MTLATSLIRFCIAATAILIAVFAMLVVRRWIIERRAPIYAARRSAITRNYLQRVAGYIEEPAAARWSVLATGTNEVPKAGGGALEKFPARLTRELVR